MIDIHSHVLPLVDDGSSSIENSIKMVKTAESQGVTDIILTPHYRNKYQLLKDELQKIFEEFKKEVISHGLKINLYLGQEIFSVRGARGLLEEGKLLTLANSKYLLYELDYNFNGDITEVAYEYSRSGFIPIFAHIERYSSVDIEDIILSKEMGALIQVNADGLIGNNGCKIKRKIKKLLKLDLVDFVASDCHENREYAMKKAYEKVAKKFGKERADKIFIKNQEKILKGST